MGIARRRARVAGKTVVGIVVGIVVGTEAGTGMAAAAETASVVASGVEAERTGGVVTVAGSRVVRAPRPRDRAGAARP